MKKIVNYMMVSMLLITGIVPSLGICEGQRVIFGGKELSPDVQYQTQTITEDHTQIGDQVSVDEKNDTIIIRLLGVFGLDTNRSNEHKFIDYARAIINMALGLVAFIALIMAIYTFYMMLFSENEAGIKKAKGNMVGIFIALAILGLAWLIVSVIFWWYQAEWQNREDDIISGNVAMQISDTIDSKQIYLTI